MSKKDLPLRKFKNISGKILNVVGFGIIKVDGILKTDKDFNNINFLEVFEEAEPTKKETKK